LKNSIRTLLAAALVAAFPTAAPAQDQPPVPEMAPAAPTNLPPQPATQPPPPPQTVAPPPVQTMAPPAAVPAPPLQAAQPASGQWVYTSEYGWIWMPFGNNCTYVPSDGGWPCMYVYYPVYSNWCWVTAPWLWGCGPTPYFGLAGPRFYFWWGRGCGYWGGFRGPYRNWGWSARSYWGGRRWVGVGGGFRGRPPAGGFSVRGGVGFGGRGGGAGVGGSFRK
jgi:hypothetical protein